MIFQSIFFFFYLLIQQCYGQESTSAGASARPQIFVHPLTNMPGSAEGVETSFFYPKYQNLKFPIGEVVTILCHLSNNDDIPYNVSAIMGSLNAPYDFSHHIQNYTYKQLGIVVRPGDEITFEYQFQLHPELQAAEYALAHTIFYDDTRMAYSTTFFNQTIELYYSDGDVNLTTLAPLLWSIISTVIIVALTIYLCFPDSKIVTQVEKSLKK